MKREIKIVIGMILLVGIFLTIQTASALDVTYCCEKTKSGGWCQNAAQDKCDTKFQMAATSCESTSYCRMGCCFDSQEGTCKENTPEKICNDNDGVWAASASCEIPQCELGCCLIGEQAAFSSLTRCKRLSSLYGLEINFRPDITDELECIASATADVKGACVFEEDFANTCVFMTKGECQKKIDAGENATFYEDVLCSDEELGTDCAPTTRTTCVEGKDEVYFVDSCGNVANVYDSTKATNKLYWSEVVKTGDACGITDVNGNADSKTCGNCDYFLGSTCKKASVANKATYGDYICADLGCTYNGNRYEHGETWCVNSQGVAGNLPGSRYFRLVCYNGDVTVEPCADFRGEICKQTAVRGFRNAACVANKWQTCTGQSDVADCLNTDVRDCQWISDRCVPVYAPGFNFWANAGTCAAGTLSYTVTYEKRIIGDWECKENCEYCKGEDGCTRSGDTVALLNNICTSYGDCGIKTNFIGVQGFNTESVISQKEQVK